MNSKSLVFSLKAVLGVSLIFLLMATYFLTSVGINFPGSSSVDEITALILFFYCGLNYKKIKYKDKKIALCFISMVIIGIISNVFSGIDRKFSYILFDIVLISKTFIGYLGMKILISKEKYKDEIVNLLYPIARVLLVVIFLCGTINIFHDIGMTKGYRYGFPSFCFVFNQPAHCALFVAILIAIVLLKEELSHKYNWLVIIGLISMIYTTKGMGLIIVASYLVLLFFIINKGTIKWYHFAILGIVAFFVLGYQIDEYLMDTTAPRAKFIIYGFEIAKKYFPFGSGFATYGSEMATRYYSPLYYMIGFSGMNGLRPGYDMYLNDNYMASILGQFGFFGLLLHILALVFIFRGLLEAKDENFKRKSFMISIFIGLISIFIASGAYKTILGMLLFMILGIYEGVYSKRNN